MQIMHTQAGRSPVVRSNGVVAIHHPPLPSIPSRLLSHSLLPCGLSARRNLYVLSLLFSACTSLHCSLSPLPFPSLTLTPHPSIPIPRADVIGGNGNRFASTQFPPPLSISQGFSSYLSITVTARTHPTSPPHPPL